MSLDSFLQSFSIAASATNIVSGMPLKLDAAPGAKELNVPLNEVVSAPLDLQLVFRHLQVPLPAGEKAWPIPPVIGTTVAGLSEKPDSGMVEAWVGSISGQIPVGLQEITISYRWAFSCSDSGVPVEVLGGDVGSQSVTLVVPPILQEMTTDDFATELAGYLQDPTQLPQLKVSFTVTASVGTVKRAEFTTPELSIPISPIPLLSVAALFRDKNFGGDSVLVMVPETSPINNGELQKLLDILGNLSDTLHNIRNAASLASWLLGLDGLMGAVNTLATQVPSMENVALRNKRENKDLGKDNFIGRWYWDTDIEDRSSSALVISALKAISFFQHDNFGGAQIALDARPNAGLTRLGGALVSDLHVAQPKSLPPGCVVQMGQPGANWGDTISSYQWAHPLPD
jgi:hypothetical protein